MDDVMTNSWAILQEYPRHVLVGYSWQDIMVLREGASITRSDSPKKTPPNPWDSWFVQLRWNHRWVYVLSKPAAITWFVQLRWNRRWICLLSPPAAIAWLWKRWRFWIFRRLMLKCCVQFVRDSPRRKASGAFEGSMRNLKSLRKAKRHESADPS